MTTLVFAQLDLPYADKGSYRQAKVKKPQTMMGGSLTTGDVAEILESRYAVYQHFYDAHYRDIAADLTEAYEGAAESLMMGAPVDLDVAGSAAEKIQERFQTFITNKEMDGKEAGVPTQAAELGHSHRFKKPYKRRAPRPSFVDTGLYLATARVEIEK